jgi:hypothetical protein
MAMRKEEREEEGRGGKNKAIIVHPRFAIKVNEEHEKAKRETPRIPLDVCSFRFDPFLSFFLLISRRMRPMQQQQTKV